MKLGAIILLLFITILYSCNKDQNDTINLCSGAQPFNADFTITQTCSSCAEWVNYQCDTVSAGQVVLTAALSNANSYEWQIGSMVNDSQTVHLSFAPGTNVVIPVTLTVNKPPTMCFPHDSSTHTLTQNMAVNSSAHLYDGKWQGYYIDSNTQQPIITNPASTITVTTAYGSPAIYGLQGADSIVNPAYSQSYKELNFQSANYPNLYGRALVDTTGNNIQFYYQYTGKDSNTANYITVYTTFQGSRL